MERACGRRTRLQCWLLVDIFCLFYAPQVRVRRALQWAIWAMCDALDEPHKRFDSKSQSMQLYFCYVCRLTLVSWKMPPAFVWLSILCDVRFYECIISVLTCTRWTLSSSFFCSQQLSLPSHWCRSVAIIILYALTLPARRRRAAHRHFCRTRSRAPRSSVRTEDKCVNEFVCAPFKYLSVNRKIIVN